MKLLSGSELVDYIKERQAKQVRNVRQSLGVIPKLAIIQAGDNPVIATYVRMKISYGEDIMVDVEPHVVSQSDMPSLIARLNKDPSVHGIIIQLPLPDPARTDEIVNLVAPQKDVDALGGATTMDPATPTAINWLLAGYGIDMAQKNIVIVGNGRLVGGPLSRMWQNSGLNVRVLDDQDRDIKPILLNADIIVSAAGVPGLITSDMIRPDAVVVDAGTTSEGGKLVGDVSADVRERNDISITPQKGGVGPLTVAALFDNVIRAARLSATGSRLL